VSRSGRPARAIVQLLVVFACLWPAALASAWWGRVGGDVPARTWSAVVYAAASRVCHQRPDRSFETAGARWPVCGRCSGLYVAAPLGALAAAAGRRGRPSARRRLAVAALPTLATLAVEWAGAPMTTALRAAAALPLGAVVAAVLVETAARPRPGIK
jgi:hypothetical protein